MQVWRSRKRVGERRRRRGPENLAKTTRGPTAWRERDGPAPRPTLSPAPLHPFQTLTAGNLASLPTAARAVAACLRSEPGAEPRPPTLPYTTLTDGAPFLKPRRLDLRGTR